MQIRPAVEDDLPAITEIYNYEVEHSTATFDTTPVTLEQQTVWLDSHASQRRPVLVADDGGTVAGWASASDWADRCAYARAAEVSVYVRANHRGRGVGRALLEALIERTREAGVGVLLARICTESEPSIHLHASLGFQSIGTMRRVGEKFGRVLDVELMDLQLVE